MADTNLTISQLVGGGDVPNSPTNQDASVGATPAAAHSDADAKDVAYVNHFYRAHRQERRPYEATWAMNAAAQRGLSSNTRWNPILNTLESRKTPPHRSRDVINIIKPKVKAKLSKFLKTRPIPVVRAASTDQEDILNAEATTKVLEALFDRLQMEELYEEAVLEAMTTGKSFIWLRWKEDAIAQVLEPAGLLTKEQVHDLPIGDVDVELGSAFEVLVADLGVARIGKQREVMRIKARDIEEVYTMFPELPPGSLKGEFRENELFQYQRQIAQLGANATSGTLVAQERNSDQEEATFVAVKELFTRPGGKFPKGRYRVVVGDKLVKSSSELPYMLYNMSNPFPCEEIYDDFTAGQFWPTTMVEQLLPIQNQRTRTRNRIDEHGKLLLNPKMVIPKQAGLNIDSSFTNEAGERIVINWQPGMPPPQQWMLSPPPLSSDAWRILDTLKSEADEVTNLYPAAMGNTGGESGFDTNLLQEAADSVHAPDIRRNELSLRGVAIKMRRIAKMGYDIPRLISIVGRDKQPQAFEFNAEQIDEHANVFIETGSALPTQKHARIEAIMKMDERQLFGAPEDPARARRVLRMMELGSADEESSLAQRDENHARLENLAFTRLEPVEDPMPWENHDIEYEIHTDLLKSQQITTWPPEQRAALVRHVILHVKWKNPANAMQLAAVFGMQDVIQEIQQTMVIEQQAQAQAAQIQQGGAPPGAPPPQGEQPAQPPASPQQPQPQAPPQAA